MEVSPAKQVGHVLVLEGQLGQCINQQSLPAPQVAVENVTGDGQLEMIVADRSGNVECYAADGQLVWQTLISKSCTSGPKVADLRLRGAMDVAVASDDG